MTFLNEHPKIRNIINKYWSILTEDPVLKNFVTSKPQITFKKAGSISSMLVQSEYKGNARKDPFKTFGTYPCGSCSQSTVIGGGATLALPNGVMFTL